MPKLPLVGDVPKGWLYAVGGGSVLVLGYVYWKRKHQAAQAATTATVTDPAGNVCAAVNPATGYCPGSPQDMAAQSGFGAGGFGGGGGGTGGPPPVQGPGSFTTNADWAQYAETQLAGAGIDPVSLLAAIGVYLTGRSATADQVSLIDQAIAVAGYPPVAGPGGFPPNIKQPPGGGGGGGKKVPNVIGSNWMGAIRTLSAAGFKPSPASKPADAKDPITGQNPAGGSTAAAGSTVTLTSPTR